MFHFRKGKLHRLEQDSDGGGCKDLKQWFDANGKVRAEYRDTVGNCKTDVWSYFEGERLVRQGQDTSGNGRPNVLNHFDRAGKLTVQEVAGEGNGSRPDKKLFLAADGAVTAQCLLDAEHKKLSVRAIVSDGIVTEVLIDTTGDGIADTREVHRDGKRVRIDADTNGDRKPDVVQTLSNGGPSRQDEDLDFDGVVDRRFVGETLVEPAPNTRIEGEAFGKLGCGSFHRFWSKR
jgi:hypothetical protein